MTTPRDEIEALLREVAEVGGREAWDTGEELPLVERARALLIAAESRGYERAREQAAEIVAEWGDGEPLDIIFKRIRAMTDERGEGTMCCRRCGEPIEKGPHGTWRHPAQTDDGHIALP